MSQVPVCYYVKNTILIRKWRPPDVSADDEWTVNHQIVVSRDYRPEILNLAHETPMSGHLDVNKTYHKILGHFFWPGLKSDVSQHCKFCHTCQIVGKPNQTIPKAYLQPIPAFDEPFSRIVNHIISTKSSYPKKYSFSENPKKYWNSKFWTPKNDPSLRMYGIIRVSPLRDIEYYPFYFQGYGILSSIYLLLSGILIFRKINYGDIFRLIRDICLFTSRDLG